MAKRIKICLILLVAVVFALFYLVEYDLPWSKNPAMIEPLLTPLVIWMVIAMVVVAIAAAGASICISLRTGNRKNVVNNIPLKKICWRIAVAVIALLCLSFGFGSTDAIIVNGKSYHNGMWLRIGDMIIITSMVLFLAACVLMIVSSVINKKS